MADFVKLDENNVVVQGIVINDNECPTEQAGVDFINNLFRTNDVWKKTDPRTHEGTQLDGGTQFRKNFAGIGYTYDEEKDAFIPPKPYNSWILESDKCIWKAPVDVPVTYTQGYTKKDADGNDILDENNNTIPDRDDYEWDESTTSWVIKERT